MSDFNNEFLDLRKKVIRKYFDKANFRQFEGITTAKGPVLILAGAGSGKTTVLVDRIANLIKFGDAYNSNEIPFFANENTLAEMKAYLSDGGNFDGEIGVDTAKPWEILAITFTNKAAGELKERIGKKLGDGNNDVWAGTFHSICARMLRRFGECIGYTSHFTIYDTDDQKRVMKEIYKRIGMNDKEIPIKSALNAISNAKDSMIEPNQFIAANANNPFLSRIGKLYKLYTDALKSADAMDFDDIIANTVKMFKQNSDSLNFYQNRFKYIMVDEYQDTNNAQYALISILSEKSQNLCVVGDDDQSIYRFRGATIENILNFESEYKNATVIRLEQNYRSTQNILDAANAVIENNTERKGKNLWTDLGVGEKIEIYGANDEQDEAQNIAKKIALGVDRGNRYSDFSVLYRMNALSNSIERTFSRAGIPYRIIGGHRFYDRLEIKDVIAYLHVINNKNDRVRLLRIINVPKRAIGAKTVETALQVSDNAEIPIFEVLKSAAEIPNLSSAAGKLKMFTEMIDELSMKVDKIPLSELFSEMLDKTGYMASLIMQGDEAEDRVENVKELLSNIVQYERESEEPTLSGFLEDVALITDIDQYDKESDAVVMMTIHAAKGLEFNNVFITGMEEGLFPGNQSIYGGNAEIEEERRLAYVAITRARKNLFISRSSTRMLYGQTTRNLPSRFLSEIPKELCDIKSGQSMFGQYSPTVTYSSSGAGSNGSNSAHSTHSTHSTGYLKNRTAQTMFKNATTQSAAPTKSAYISGQRVKHKVFGEGMILSVMPMGTDSLLEIAFDQKGTKKLMSNFAKLEIL